MAEREAELEPGVVVVLGAALTGHVLGDREQAVDVDPHQRCRHDPERRERRVAPADRRLAVEDRPEAALLRERLERRPGVGDRHELSASPAGLLPEVVGVGAGLERRAGLRRREKERPLQVELRLERPDGLRVRRVEDVEERRVERPPQDLGREARAAHAEQDAVVELLERRLGELDELLRPRPHPRRLVEPAQPLVLAGVGPDGGVASPDPADELRVVHRLRRRRARPAWPARPRAAPRTSRRTSARPRARA